MKEKGIDYVVSKGQKRQFVGSSRKAYKMQ